MTAEVGLVVTDADGRVRVSDKRARTLLSWAGRAESFADLLARMGVVGERLAGLLDEMRRGTRDRLSVECQLGAGTEVRWLRITAMADRLQDGRLDRIAWTLIDISDQRRETQAAERTHRVLDEALVGADDGELFLETSASESLAFDDGRLKVANFDAERGFGLRGVFGEASGFAHSSDPTLAALKRAGETASAARQGRGMVLLRHSLLWP